MATPGFPSELALTDKMKAFKESLGTLCDQETPNIDEAFPDSTPKLKKMIAEMVTFYKEDKGESLDDTFTRIMSMTKQPKSVGGAVNTIKAIGIPGMFSRTPPATPSKSSSSPAPGPPKASGQTSQVQLAKVVSAVSAPIVPPVSAVNSTSGRYAKSTIGKLVIADVSNMFVDILNTITLGIRPIPDHSIIVYGSVDFADFLKGPTIEMMLDCGTNPFDAIPFVWICQQDQSGQVDNLTRFMYKKVEKPTTLPDTKIMDSNIMGGILTLMQKGNFPDPQSEATKTGRIVEKICGASTVDQLGKRLISYDPEHLKATWVSIVNNTNAFFTNVDKALKNYINKTFNGQKTLKLSTFAQGDGSDGDALALRLVNALQTCGKNVLNDQFYPTLHNVNKKVQDACPDYRKNCYYAIMLCWKKGMSVDEAAMEIGHMPGYESDKFFTKLGDDGKTKIPGEYKGFRPTYTNDWIRAFTDNIGQPHKIN